MAPAKCQDDLKYQGEKVSLNMIRHIPRKGQRIGTALGEVGD
jgi:hypothetical protein